MREKDRILLEVKLLTDVAEAIGNTYLTNKLKNLGNLICAEFNKDLEFQLETLKKQNEHLL